jgi:hypothetical protein
MSKPTGGTYHPNDALAAVIVRAWSEPAFRNRLVTGPSPNDVARDACKAALREAGISLRDVVVLTEDQVEDYEPAEGHENETAFVLPNPISDAPSMDTARIAMAATVDGI